MKLCPRLSRIESLKVRYSVDQSGLGTAVVEVAAEFHVHSNTLEMLSHFRSKRVLCLPFYSHFQPVLRNRFERNLVQSRFR